jgi:hypothetical protein
VTITFDRAGVMPAIAVVVVGNLPTIGSEGLLDVQPFISTVFVPDIQGKAIVVVSRRLEELGIG